MKELIFVYGTLKSGRGNNRYMGDSKRLCNHTTESVYTMKTTGGFPIVERDGNTSIAGEIYLVDKPETLLDIYRLEGFKGEKGNLRNWYDIDIISTPLGEAKIFVMDKDKNNLPVIESGIF